MSTFLSRGKTLLTFLMLTLNAQRAGISRVFLRSEVFNSELSIVEVDIKQIRCGKLISSFYFGKPK